MAEDKLPERIQREINWFRQLGGEVIVDGLSITLKPGKASLAVATEYLDRIEAENSLVGEPYEVHLSW